MYSFLLQKLGMRWANVLIVCWYVLILILIYYFSPVTDGRFNYMGW